jgi:hypothetical protein
MPIFVQHNMAKKQETFDACVNISVGLDIFLVYKSEPKKHAQKNESIVFKHVCRNIQVFKMAAKSAVLTGVTGLNLMESFKRQMTLIFR